MGSLLKKIQKPVHVQKLLVNSRRVKEEFTRQVTCCQILHVPVKRAHFEFSLGGISVLPWIGKLQMKAPCLYASLWALNLKTELVDADSKLQSHKGTEFIYQIRQTNKFLLVQTQEFPLIQVLVQVKTIYFPTRSPGGKQTNYLIKNI